MLPLPLLPLLLLLVVLLLYQQLYQLLYQLPKYQQSVLMNLLQVLQILLLPL